MSTDNRNDDPRFNSNNPIWRNTYYSYNLNSKILLVTIITFSIIILTIFAFHLYAKFFLPRNTSEDLSVVSHPPKRGLDSLAIASLPTFVIGVNDDLSATECPVCLSLFEEKDTARMLPNCKHVFHVTCVDTWLITCSTCPVCRTDVEPSLKLEPEPREGPVRDFAVGSSSYNKTGVDQDHVWDLERQ